MKLGMFTTKESYINWLKNEIEAIRNNGLIPAMIRYQAALKGEGKEEWMRCNNIPETDEEYWNRHLDWMREDIAYLNRKIRKYQREIAKNC